MAQLKLYKVNALPAVLKPSALYFIKNDVTQILNMYLTDASGALVYRNHDSSDISQIIIALINSIKGQPGGLAELDLNGNVIGASSVSSLIKYSGNVDIISGNTIIRFNNSTPSITEGTEIWSKTITPKSLTSDFSIMFSGTVDTSNNNQLVLLTLFRDNIYIGHAITPTYDRSIRSGIASIIINDAPNTLLPITYSCRIGVSLSGNIWYLGRAENATLGNSNKSGWVILEG